jgi:hypothetical protein
MRRQLAVLLLLLACEGRIVGPRPPEGTPPAGDAVSDVQCLDAPAPPTPMRRLSRDDYAAAVERLFAVSPIHRDGLPADESLAGFVSNTVTPLSAQGLEGYLASATAIAARIDPSTAVPCGAMEVPRACAQRAITRWTRLVFRGQVEAGTTDDLLALWDAEARVRGPAEANTLVLEALVSSPQFLYRPERGRDGRLTGLELASRLSFLLEGTTPEAWLLDLADGDGLSTVEGRRSAAARLRRSPRAASSLARFYAHWLELDELDRREKDPILFPGFSQRRSALKAETLEYFTAAHEAGWTVERLFTDPSAIVSGPTADLTGLMLQGTNPQRVQLDATRRAGLLTLPGVLAASAHTPDHASPIYRGRFVRQQLLCLPLSSPPPGIMAVLPPVTPEMTVRQRYTATLTNDTCGGCHRLMNPLGFGFLQYDTTGRFLERDPEGRPIDPSFELVGSQRLDRAYDSVVDFAPHLARSEELRGCVARQWLRESLGRPDTPTEACAVRALPAVRSASTSLDDTFDAVLESAAFLTTGGSP